MIRIDCYVHLDHWPSDNRLDEILTIIKRLETATGVIMANLDDILAKVAQETTDIGSLKVFIAGLKQQIADALAGVTLPPAVQAKVDAVFSGVTANDQAVIDAMAANVPPTP
jgi:hypothetical protein